MERIALIGVGGIGFRHFQSLVTDMKGKLELTVVDVSEEAITRAKEWENGNRNIYVDISYKSDVSEIEMDMDIVIIATSSLVRREVFDKLLKNINTQYIIFEKFLFPRLSDYEEVREQIKEKKIKAYVNCPCRLYPGYVALKKEILDADRISAILTGSNWGMACNVIHTIDVLGYLLDTYDELKVDTILLDEEVFETKRKGYIEFTGRLICNMGKKIQVVFDSDKTGSNPFKLTIFSKNKVYTIFEVDQKMIVSHSGKSYKVDFPIYYQSQLTADIVNELLDNGDCELTRYEDTIQWHKALLTAFLEKYRLLTSTSKEICPIT